MRNTKWSNSTKTRMNKECVRHCDVMFDSRTNAWENRVHDIKVKVFTRTFIKVSLWVPSLYWSDFYFPLLSILEPDWADSSSSESCLGVEIELLANRTQVIIDFWLRAVMLTPVYRWFIFCLAQVMWLNFIVTCMLHLLGFGANESEYKWEGISQAQPGYLLTFQVPPISSSISRMVALIPSFSLSWTAAHIPLNLLWYPQRQLLYND